MNHAVRLPSLPPWEHWNTERLRKEATENPRAFDRGFRMRAFSDSERQFPSFSLCYAHGVVTGEVARRGWPVFVGADLSGPKRPGNALAVVALDPSTQRRFPIEMHTGAWTSPETARMLADINARHPNIRVVMVENNGYQQALIDWVRSSPVDYSFWFKVEAFTTGAQKNAPMVGVPSLEIEFHNKAWVVPADEFDGHPLTCRCGWCTWNREMTNYPMSATTDTVMATWFAREGISRAGFDGLKVALGDINAR